MKYRILVQDVDGQRGHSQPYTTSGHMNAVLSNVLQDLRERGAVHYTDDEGSVTIIPRERVAVVRILKEEE